MKRIMFKKKPAGVFLSVVEKKNPFRLFFAPMRVR